MRMAGAWAAWLIGAASLQAQVPHDVPVCRAERRGPILTTRIDYPDGYSVEGPWRVTSFTRAGPVSTVRVVLDRIVEIRPLTSTLRSTALPSAIEMTFRGKSLHQLLDEAASVWCLTVMKARPYQPAAPTRDALAQNRVVM